MKPIYLDYNASTPVIDEVAEAMRPYLQEFFGNPSSSHWYGIQSRKAIETARTQIAQLINCKPDEIVFTSGGTESNNHAIRSSAVAGIMKGNQIITSAVEHPAVEKVCEFLSHQGYEIITIPVDKFGLINPLDVENAITEKTILITIMHANNETGTIQPIEEIGKIAQKHGIRFHTDAAQSLGKIEVNVEKLGVDLLSIAGHKLYAPKGVGALYIRRGTKLPKFLLGAGHESDRRAGTENVLEIVGLGKAAEIAKRDLVAHMLHFQAMRDLLFEKISAKLPCHLNGHPRKRLPNTLNLSFPDIDNLQILSLFTSVAASSGAACHSDSVTISPVLQAMRVPDELAINTIRFSTGKLTTPDEIESAAKLIISELSS